MYLGQGIDIITQVKSDIDRRVGEFYLAKSRLVRVDQLLEAMRGKLSQEIYDIERKRVNQLKSDAVVLSNELGKISNEASKQNPDYFIMVGAIGVFARMDDFVTKLREIEGSVEGEAKGVGISLEPFSYMAILSLGIIAIGMLFRLKKRG